MLAHLWQLTLAHLWQLAGQGKGIEMRCAPGWSVAEDLGISAWKKAQAVLHSSEFPMGASTARQRGIIRDNLESELNQINKLVITLFA